MKSCRRKSPKDGRLITCALASVLVFCAAHIPQSRYRYVLGLDAIGLALFAVDGAEKAADVGAGSIVAVAMGVITATFGGIVRDLLGGESPVILSREIYASAALAGALVFVGYGWSLPRYRERAPRARRN